MNSESRGSFPGKIVLVGWDAADWQFIDPLLDAGEMPALASLVDRGVIGNLATLEPILSPLLWTTIATGKRAHEHEVLGFAEPAPESESGIRPISSTARKSKALWNIADECGLRSQVVNFFASHPAEPIRGQIVSNQFPHPTGPDPDDWPMPEQSLHPADLVETLRELRLHPRDIEAEELLPFFPKLTDDCSVEAAEKIERFRQTLAQTATVHAAHTQLLHRDDTDFAAVYYDWIDRCSHDFMQYYPPQMEHVSDAEFVLFRDAMRGVYRFQDLMLARTLELAGPDATIVIVSDHGFHSGRLRPGPKGKVFIDGVASEHRPYGVFLAAGPGIRKDERVSGATLLDVAPTLLHALGLPVGEDMPGRVLEEIFEVPVAVRSIPSWQATEAPNRLDGVEAPNPWEDLEGLRRLVELGYMPALEEDKEKNLERCHFEMRKNRARDLLHAGKAREAAPIFAELAAERPNGNQLATFHARALFEAGDHEGCRAAIDALEARLGHSPAALLLRGTLESAMGNPREALEALLLCEQWSGEMQGLQRRIGAVYLKLGEWSSARRAFERALELDPDHARAWHGLAVAFARLGDHGAALRAGQRAVALQPFFPVAHLALGVAAGRVGEIELARRALETSIAQRPTHPAAYQALAQVLEQGLGDAEGGARHRREAERLDAAQ